jgi:RsiW-degrading membrane proteinase PrsW (M82 family)
MLMRDSFASFPVATGLSLCLFGLYAVGFIALLREIDYLQREPLPAQLLALAWGGLVATTAAISGGTALADILAKTVSPGYAATWGPAVAAAGLEEILKVLGVLALALLGRALLTSVIAGFVYGALVGLGFQVVEDVVFGLNAVALQGGDDQVGPVVLTFLLRGFIGGLWSHTLFTALSGAGVAYAVVRRDRSRTVRALVAVGLFTTAWGLHFLWNSPLLENGLGHGTLGAIGAIVIKGVPALAVGTTLLLAAERREADYYSAILASVNDSRIASPDEIAALVSPRRRLEARRHARVRLGMAGGRATRRLQRAQARLASALARDPAGFPGPETLSRRAEVLTRRHELAALSISGTRYSRRTVAVTVGAVMVAQAAAIAALVAGIGVAIRMLSGGP